MQEARARRAAARSAPSRRRPPSPAGAAARRAPRVRAPPRTRRGTASAARPTQLRRLPQRPSRASSPKLHMPCSTERIGLPMLPFECDAVRVQSDVGDADTGADQARDRHERGEGRRERGSGDPRSRDRQPESGRHAAAAARGEPAGDRQEHRPGQRDEKDDDTELAAVEAEPVLQRREARSPGAVERAEGDEHDGERNVRLPKPSRHHPARLENLGDPLHGRGDADRLEPLRRRLRRARLRQIRRECMREHRQ